MKVIFPRRKNKKRMLKAKQDVFLSEPQTDICVRNAFVATLNFHFAKYYINNRSIRTS